VFQQQLIALAMRLLSCLQRQAEAGEREPASGTTSPEPEETGLSRDALPLSEEERDEAEDLPLDCWTAAYVDSELARLRASQCLSCSLSSDLALESCTACSSALLDAWRNRLAAADTVTQFDLQLCERLQELLRSPDPRAAADQLRSFCMQAKLPLPQLDIDGLFAAALRAALANVGTHNSQGEKYLTDAAAEILRAGGQVQAIAIDDSWLVAGVNDRVQLSEVAAELNWRICESWQRAGVTILDPATTFIDVTVQLAEDVTLLPGTHLKGISSIATGATVGPEVYLVDSSVGQRASVIKSHVTGSRIGDDATVGPFAYLRPGTDLGADGKIGTFVETKNAIIGAGSKVPHLSYVGDAEIGEDSNIGAGTIFANYDGVNKHRSVIGRGVRSGSHNVFVAPISIGDGAYTAAGTVVRKNVEPGSLAMSVAPQRNLSDWVATNRAGTAAAEAAEAAKSAQKASNDTTEKE